MDFKKHLERAWNQTLKHLVPLVLMTLLMSILVVLTLGILGPVMLAGYFQSIVSMIRDGREPRLQDLFAQMHLFLPLLGFSFLALIVFGVGLMLFILPGLAVVCAITFGCLYMLPLMTDRKMRLFEALQESMRMALRGNVADHIVVVILFIGLMAIGGSLFIGTLLTQPFASVFVISVYLERTGGDAQSSAPPPPPVV